MLQTILMCPPDYFGVDYVINPWMENQVGKAEHALAIRQWNDLREALAKQAKLVFMDPKPGLPDMVFTANAGLVFDKKVIVSRFYSPHRQGEEMYDRAWFEQHDFTLVDWPSVSFEGAGDALFDRGQKIIWVGHGFRSNAEAAIRIGKLTGFKSIALKLVDPRFYHLDTCLCPLEGGWLLYYPQAFDQESREKIAATVPDDKRIAINDDDALRFACNAVDLNRHVFLNDASDDLQNCLKQAGFTPVLTPLSEFMKAGGAAKCLTLKLVEP